MYVAFSPGQDFYAVDRINLRNAAMGKYCDLIEVRYGLRIRSTVFYLTYKVVFSLSRPRRLDESAVRGFARLHLGNDISLAAYAPISSITDC